MACATELAPAGGSEVRKVVTVLFADVPGSTALGEGLDPESFRRVMARYFDAARGAVEAHGGTVEKFIGDAVMAVFGVPTVHEDDALRALRAAAGTRSPASTWSATTAGRSPCGSASTQARWSRARPSASSRGTPSTSRRACS